MSIIIMSEHVVPGLMYDILQESAQSAHATKLAIIRGVLGKTAVRNYAGTLSTATVLAGPTMVIARPLARSKIAGLFHVLNQRYKLNLTANQAEATTAWAFSHLDLLHRIFHNMGKRDRVNVEASLNITKADWDGFFALFTPAQVQAMTHAALHQHVFAPVMA